VALVPFIIRWGPGTSSDSSVTQPAAANALASAFANRSQAGVARISRIDNFRWIAQNESPWSAFAVLLPLAETATVGFDLGRAKMPKG
jgi:hypothetical protein